MNDFQVKVANSTYYLLNTSPLISINYRTFEEIWFSSSTNFEKFKIFYCPSYDHVNKGKLDPRTRKCIFLGYEIE